MRIKLSVAGVSFGDTYMRRGYYAPPHTYPTKLPYIPGLDGWGQIDAVGAGVNGWKVGDRVTYCLGYHSYAQYVTVQAWKVVKIPDGFDEDVACALMINGLTAYYLTHFLYPLKTGDTCLVHAGAGSVGQMVIQLAKSRGARVITTVGSREKAEIAKNRGADEVVFYREVDFVDAVRRLTDGRGVDVAYDSVGLETYRRSMKCLRVRGVCSLYGAASGIPDCVRPMEDLAENGSIFVTRSHLAHYIRNKDDLDKATSALFSAYKDGKLAVALHQQPLDLAQASEAHRALEARETTGKILLRIP
ncbi:MAG: quinone oxidoreductase family protein [Vulcanimicrobiaceae bacterium]